MRNLLGRLNARSSDDLVRIANFWRVSLPGTDRGRHVGVIYRVMSDIRACRDAWERFDPTAREIVRLLAASEAGPLTIAEIATRLELPEESVRESAVQLFRWGLLSVQGDNQELPIGERPRLFLPRELGQDYRRILDEMTAGNQVNASLRTLLEGRDDPDLEETATLWGLRIIPGLRRRQELVDDILHQMASKQRIDEVAANLGRSARALYDVVRKASEEGPVRYADALGAAKLTVPDAPVMRAVAAGTVLREALIELESSALVLHTYLDDGSRAFFVPHELLHPGTVMTAVQLPPLEPLDPETVPEPEMLHPFAIAWDLLTIVREVISRGAPVWVPGEPLSLTWQRQLNRRLWFGRDEIPPEGYIGMLLYLALGVDVLEPGPHMPGAGGDRHAVRPVPSGLVRQWRSRTFADQIAALRDVWLVADQWIEGREREQIDVWGADWQGFRRRLLGALREIEAGSWFVLTDVARRIAGQDPGLIGSTFTAASARGGRDRGNARTAAIAQIVEVELETAMWWFGFVEIARIPRKGLAVRVTDAARLAAGDSRAVPELPKPARDEPVLSVDATGLVTLHQPAPVHIWSLTAFGDAERLRPEATYQLRPGSVGRALGAGFDLEQIAGYLEHQGGKPLPDGLMHLLREWTAGYKRVRMRRAAILTPDFETGIDELRKIVTEAGLEIVDGGVVPQGGLVVLLPATGEDAASAEETLQAALRAAGFVGQWAMDKRT
jgi:DNA-binding IclR family transcriptional regulator